LEVIDKNESNRKLGLNISEEDFRIKFQKLRKMEHCLDIGCMRDQQNIASGTRHEVCRAVHAEQNAIIQSALHGISIKDATIYCTHQPCILCAKMLINAHIKRVVFEKSYPDRGAIDFFNMAAVEVVQLSSKIEEK